jgi:hypothetical protein
MEILLALLLQSAANAASPPAAPALAYANDAAAQSAPRPRINQGRSFQLDLGAMEQSLTTESRQERRPAAPARTPARPAPGRTNL